MALRWSQSRSDAHRSRGRRHRHLGGAVGLAIGVRHFLIVTNVMPFTRLLASTKLPSGVTDVLRTMLPPPGIAQLWNFAVLGSKRTTVFGVCLLYTSPSPRDRTRSRMPSSA